MSYATRVNVLVLIRQQMSAGSATRWADSVLYAYLLEAEKRIVGGHPEAQYIDRVENVAPVLLTAASTVFTISDDWETALADYTLGQCFKEDADDTYSAQRAGIHLNDFAKAMANQ